MVFSVQEFLEQLVHLILTERVLEQRGSSVSKGSSGKGGRGSRVVIASSSSSKGDRSSVKGGRVASSSSSNVLLRKVVVGLQVPNGLMNQESFLSRTLANHNSICRSSSNGSGLHLGRWQTKSSGQYPCLRLAPGVGYGSTELLSSCRDRPSWLHP